MNHNLLFGKEVEPGSWEPSTPLVLRATSDYDVLFLTSFRVPTTGGGTAVLPSGELIKVVSYREGAAAASCLPLRHDE